MNSILLIYNNIIVKFPGINAQYREADDSNGFRFLNIYFNDGFEIAVEWKHDTGFDIQTFDASSHPLDGLFSGSSDPFKNEAEAIQQIDMLITQHLKE